jgi:hypothetical protein
MYLYNLQIKGDSQKKNLGRKYWDGACVDKLMRSATDIDLVVTIYNFNNYNLIPPVLTAEITGSSTLPAETK